MKFCSDSIPLSALPEHKGFSLPEVIAALIILAFVSSGVLVVVNRCVASAADLSLRMKAFEIARDNMEKLLVSNSVQGAVEYGISEKYPEIQWQTVVETFYEPVTERMWAQAICSAEYTDATGELQKVELTHWLTQLTKKQMEQVLEAQEEEEERLEEEGEIIETAEEAADYAGVDVETIRQWVRNGMRTTKNRYYIKSELDRYERTGGTGREAPPDFDTWPADLPEVELPDAEEF